MKYGLIGERLSHSFSIEIHRMLCDYRYELLELSPAEIDVFFRSPSFRAINVTIPYKERVIPFLSYVDPLAMSVGAVNTVVNKNGMLYGYNTDFYGLDILLKQNKISVKGKKVLILGTGGTSNTAYAVCRHNEAEEILKVTRGGRCENAVGYKEACEIHNDAEIIINTTPCGMYPDICSSPIDISKFEKLEGVADAVYNPLKTKFILDAEKKGIKTAAGLYMLVAQAVKAAEIFTENNFEIGTLDRVYKSILLQKENIVLIGMPGSGKTTVGRKLAKMLGRELIDTDKEITELENRSIKEIFSGNGEDYFRRLESDTVERISARQSCIIATGGGVVLNESNVDALRKNGKIVFIDRDPSLISISDDRPLSSDREGLMQRYNERIGRYRTYADFTVDGNGDIAEVACRIIDEIGVKYENTRFKRTEP